MAEIIIWLILISFFINIIISRLRKKIEKPASKIVTKDDRRYNHTTDQKTSFTNAQYSTMSWRKLIETVHASVKKQDNATITNLQRDYKVQMAFWALFINRYKNDNVFFALPFEYNNAVIEKAKSYQNGKKIIKDKMITMLHKDLETYKPAYFITGNGQIGRETNSVGNYDTLLVQASSFLRGRAVSANNLTPLALEAIGHYARMPIVSYFFALPSLNGSFSASPDDINQMEVSIYTGTESILLEIYGELENGGVITDELVVKKIEGLFEKT